VERREASAPEARCGGNVAIAWRAPRPEHRQAVTSVGVARLFVGACRRSAPLYFFRGGFLAVALPKLGRKQKTRRENEIACARLCERSEAIQGRGASTLDCFVAELVIGPAISGRTRWLLAMTDLPILHREAGALEHGAEFSI
jgi:hypothetical protein